MYSIIRYIFLTISAPKVLISPSNRPGHIISMTSSLRLLSNLRVGSHIEKIWTHTTRILNAHKFSKQLTSLLTQSTERDNLLGLLLFIIILHCNKQ